MFLESPGSITFEVQDVPAIADVAHARGRARGRWTTRGRRRTSSPACSMVSTCRSSRPRSTSADTPTSCSAPSRRPSRSTSRPVDGGRAGLLRESRRRVPRASRSSDVRHAARAPPAQYAAGGRVAAWLAPRSSASLYPALPSDPGHALWKRDFTGASGLFGVVLHPVPKAGCGRDAEFAAAVRHGGELRWIREPRDPDESVAAPRGHAVDGAAGRTFVSMLDSRIPRISSPIWRTGSISYSWSRRRRRERASASLARVLLLCATAMTACSSSAGHRRTPIARVAGRRASANRRRGRDAPRRSRTRLGAVRHLAGRRLRDA